MKKKLVRNHQVESNMVQYCGQYFQNLCVGHKMFPIVMASYGETPIMHHLTAWISQTFGPWITGPSFL